MKAIDVDRIDWDTVDLEKVVGDFIDMPDGSKHYIEMAMLHWYWLNFMSTRNSDSIEIAKGIFEIAGPNILQEDEETFNYMFVSGVDAWAKERARIQTEGL